MQGGGRKRTEHQATKATGKMQKKCDGEERGDGGEMVGTDDCDGGDGRLRGTGYVEEQARPLGDGAFSDD